ncbi:MAG: hypothetical protein ACRDLF_13545 [Solirubrobacteraceae bacterium]
MIAHLVSLTGEPALVAGTMVVVGGEGFSGIVRVSECTHRAGGRGASYPATGVATQPGEEVDRTR